MEALFAKNGWSYLLTGRPSTSSKKAALRLATVEQDRGSYVVAEDDTNADKRASASIFYELLDSTAEAAREVLRTVTLCDGFIGVAAWAALTKAFDPTKAEKTASALLSRQDSQEPEDKNSREEAHSEISRFGLQYFRGIRAEHTPR